MPNFATIADTIGYALAGGGLGLGFGWKGKASVIGWFIAAAGFFILQYTGTKF